jgi:hypothetical protein
MSKKIVIKNEKLICSMVLYAINFLMSKLDTIKIELKINNKLNQKKNQ